MKAIMSSLRERRLSDGITGDCLRCGVRLPEAVLLYFGSQTMIFSKDYVGYLARQTVKQLIAEKMISTEKPGR